MNFNFLEYPYASRRTAVFASNGVVATSQYLAAQAGLDILRKGGNAIDAAIAVAACLTVTEPTSNGIGGDAFAIVWTNNQLYGLNASGPAPQLINKHTIYKSGYTQIPRHGWIPVTVPGIPAAWRELSVKFGKLPFSKLLEPAITYAEKGYPVSPVVSYNWNLCYQQYRKDLKDTIFQEWFKIFAPSGHAPKPGELWSSPDHARTLTSIAESNAQSFYTGDIAERMIDFSQKTGGYLLKEDLENYKPEWVNPISINYRGYDIWELPPNGHGLIVLLALNILEGFDIDELGYAIFCHKLIEAIKLAFADGFKYIADPDYMNISLPFLLSKEYADKRRKLITDKALPPERVNPECGGTVYLATADSEGNMVSYIQSNYTGFGSGLVVPGTGIALHNRGCCFTLEDNHPNCLMPGKRPYHTIIPGFITRNNQAIGPFGVMGALMQPQGHVQVITNMIDRKLNPQATLDAPRWQWTKDNSILVESSFPEEIVNFLKSLEHNVIVSSETASFGRGQIIWKNENNVLSAGTEPRADSLIACW